MACSKEATMVAEETEEDAVGIEVDVEEAESGVHEWVRIDARTAGRRSKDRDFDPGI